MIRNNDAVFGLLPDTQKTKSDPGGVTFCYGFGAQTAYRTVPVGKSPRASNDSVVS